MTFNFAIADTLALHMVIRVVSAALHGTWRGDFGPEYYSPIEIMGVADTSSTSEYVLFPLLYRVRTRPARPPQSKPTGHETYTDHADGYDRVQLGDVDAGDGHGVDGQAPWGGEEYHEVHGKERLVVGTFSTPRHIDERRLGAGILAGGTVIDQIVPRRQTGP